MQRSLTAAVRMKSPLDVHAMPASTACAHCGTVGLVRLEHVIKGGHAILRHYCGSCDHTWDEISNRSPIKGSPKKTTTSERPERSRRLT